MKHKCIPFLVLVFFAVQCSAQNNELLNKLYSASGDKKNTLLLLCKLHHSINSDSFLKYIRWGIQLCKPNSQEAYIFKIYKIYYLDDISQYQAAENLTDSVIEFCKNNPTYTWPYCKSLSCKAGYLIHKGKNTQALQLGYEAVKSAEKTKDTQLILDVYLSIGFTNMESNKNKEAIYWFEKGIQFASTSERRKKLTNIYLNAASCYNNEGNYSRALKLVNIGIENSKLQNRFVSIANGLMIRSDIYINTKQFHLAELDLKEALIFRAKTKDTLYLASDMAQYSLYCASVNQPKKGIELATIGLELIKNYKAFEKELFLYQALAKNYELDKNYLKLSQIQSKIMDIKDTLQKNNINKEIAEAQAKYEVEKKELIINNQNLTLKVKQLYIYGLIALIILLLPFIYYWVTKLRKRLKNKLSEEIEIERRRISNDLHDGVGAYASSLYNGIRNLPSENRNNLQQTASDLIEKLNQTVWVLDKESIALSDLFDKYKNWFVKIISNYEGIQYEFSDEITNNKIIKPQDSLDLLNIFQEITNNALKHSKCTTFKCSITTQNKRTIVEFTDDGIGFKLIENNMGYGLQNIEKRIKKLSANIYYFTENGTKINIDF